MQPYGYVSGDPINEADLSGRAYIPNPKNRSGTAEWGSVGDSFSWQVMSRGEVIYHLYMKSGSMAVDLWPNGGYVWVFEMDFSGAQSTASTSILAMQRISQVNRPGFDGDSLNRVFIPSGA